jgi:hypothetical protein
VKDRFAEGIKMPDETQLKQIINRAITRAYETHGQNVEGVTMPNGVTARVIGNAVYDALRRANAFRDS